MLHIRITEFKTVRLCTYHIPYQNKEVDLLNIQIYTINSSLEKILRID